MQSSSSPSIWSRLAGAAKRAAAHRWAVGRGMIVGAAVVWAAFWVGLSLIVPGIYEEHGPMENFQVVILVMGMLVGGLMALNKKLGPPARILMAGMALFFLMFFLLEFDTRLLDTPTLRRWTNGALRNLWVGALLLTYGIILARRFKEVWELFLRWLAAVPGMFMVISGFFWVAGFIVDKLHFKEKAAGLFMEELLECEATLFMGLAVLLTRLFFK